MNQILITEKLYITPELKRKKKFYRLEFFLSVFLICILFSYYIYAEYDKTKSEEVSQDILADTEIEKKDNATDNTTIKTKDNVLVVILDEDTQVANAEQTTTQPEEKTEPPSNKVMQTKSGTKYTTVAIVKIPKINVEYSVLSHTTDELLKISPTRFWGPAGDSGTNDANEVGNYCIVGHNYRNKRFFSKVPTLENGDIIELTDMTGRTLKYMVYNKYEVDPTDVSCTSQKTNGKKEITLITCTNDSKHRVIVKATEVL